ncbi:MAG TPA: hypothetical protein VG944_05805, partial [Fimbriimonas sp.]|nr:hypothetical protein [Fimbriimonas sp.]
SSVERGASAEKDSWSGVRGAAGRYLIGFRNLTVFAAEDCSRAFETPNLKSGVLNLLTSFQHHVHLEAPVA